MAVTYLFSVQDNLWTTFVEHCSCAFLASRPTLLPFSVPDSVVITCVTFTPVVFPRKYGFVDSYLRQTHTGQWVINSDEGSGLFLLRHVSAVTLFCLQQGKWLEQMFNNRLVLARSL